MGILIKYIIKNIFEKKFRTFIIVISVTLSAALFFASSAISGTITSMYEAQIKMQTGKADLLINPNQQSPSDFFSIQQQPIDGVAYIVGDVSVGGNYMLPKAEAQASKIQSQRLHLRGFDLEDLEVLNPINFSKYAVDREFKGNHIILSSVFAEKYAFDVGDTIDIEIRGTNRRLVVWGIARPTGLFRIHPQSDSMTAVMPKDTLASLYNVRSRVNSAYVVLEEGAEVEKVKNTLSSLYPRYTVGEPFSSEELAEYLNVIVVPFFLMTTMVLFISIFIIYSTFKVITVERLPIIGTFRSIGATKRMTDAVLIGESLTYGVLGGVLGNLLGIGILYLMTDLLASDPWSGRMDVTMEFGLGHMIAAFLLAVGVAFISSWIPIARTSKIPIKDLVLNMVEGKTRKKRWKVYAGIGFILFSIIAPRISPKFMALPASTISMLLSTMAVIMFVPYITKGFLQFLEKIYESLFGNEGILAAKNLNDNKNILNNISLLAIGISALLMINTLSHSVSIEVLQAYNDWDFDIMVSVHEGDRNTEQILRAVEGVAATYGTFETWEGVKVADVDYRIRYIQGIDTNKYRDYVAFRTEGDPDRVLQQLDEGRNIIVANMAKERLGLKVGDTITLEMKSGNRSYHVIGFHDSIMMNGSNALISERYYKMDMQQPYFDTMYVKTSKNPDDVLVDIQTKFMRRGMWGSTVADMEQRNTESNNQIFLILKAFSVLAMLIGIFGVFNNYMISFIERKRSIAILRSVGLSKKQTLKMILVESLTGGLIGGVVGIIGGTLMLSSIPYVMKAIQIPIGIHYAKSFFINAVIGGIIIAVLASVSPASKTSKLNIIEAIKYE
ncbi:putative ABC transport system permease protein [Natronincola peptidivorans]|uniref:Putative ABC transport system permease protein n=1 Tax=Natronincola peptidivorans TaxID=426128 RepID=A0A1I0AW89_9FIRM|nr:FtsX-like permease family protein [Natronincola peptidivorans]SES98661.1 putative ABC transport system permease protein [Natronincola peptidivorans]